MSDPTPPPSAGGPGAGGPGAGGPGAGALADDDVRDLFSEHLEGTLDDERRRLVDAALAGNPALRAEQQRFAKTVELLRALPKEDAPPNLVANVRQRLAAERVAERREQQPAAVVELAPRIEQRRRPAFEYVAGFAALAAVVAIVAVGVPALQQRGGGGGGGLLTAGAGVDAAVSLSWRAPGMARIDVVEAAQRSGMTVQDDGSFAGDRQSAARFFVALKTKAAAAGSELSAHVPEAAERVVVVVSP